METLRRCFHGRVPAGGAVAYSRHRDPEDEAGGGPRVLLPPPRPRPRSRPRPRPRPWLHPLAALALGSASAFLAGLLVAGLWRPACGGGAGAGPDPAGPAPEEAVGVASAEAPPTWPQLREQLQRHLREERIEAWVREVAAGPHGAGSARGQALARGVLSAMGAAGLSRAWSRPQRLPLPTRGSPPSLLWVDAAGRELERLRLDPDAFCPWSAAGNVTGELVYGHYGRPQDLALLRARGVTLGGSLLLLRMGRGTPAAKVAAAEAVGAAGVLLYPDPQDTAGPGGAPALGGDTAVTVHVQEGAGDPYSRGFPSFTARAPPRRPPGLPRIPVQPLSAATATRLLRELGGPRAPWGLRLRAPGGRRLRLSVGGGTAPGTLVSVFGALEGRLEPDRYVIVGARRDSLGPGAAASGVGTALLLELARVFAAMGRDGFQLRRSLLFVSWDGGEFGHLGATEWLEGYPALLHTKAAAYISLDQAVLGDDRLVARSSPVLVSLIESALRQVDSPNENGKSLFEQVTRPGRAWQSDVIRPLSPESGAYPFTAAAGVPAVELCFDEAPGGGSRAALGTREDTLGRLQGRLRGRLPAVARAVAAVAAQLLLRLAHDPRLPLDPGALGDALLRRLAPLQTRGVSLQGLYSARGDVARAAARLRQELEGSEGSNERLNRGFNARIMAAEASLLSPFVSPLAAPFRHVLLGRGGHTLPALAAELGGARGGTPGGGHRGGGHWDGVHRDTSACAWPYWPGPYRARPGRWRGTRGAGGRRGTAGGGGTTGTMGTFGIMGSVGAGGGRGIMGAGGTTGTWGLPGSTGTGGAPGTVGTSGIFGIMGAGGAGGAMGTLGSMGVNGDIRVNGVSVVNGDTGVDGGQWGN